MSTLEHLRRLWSHCVWADDLLLEAIRQPGASPAAAREHAHIVGAEEVWLSRLEGRASRVPVWPELTAEALSSVARQVSEGYEQYLASMQDDDLTKSVAYANTAGRSFATPIGEILTHVMLHGQYHRGKVNLLLRQFGVEPAPVDYIAFVRGVPAARTEISPYSPRSA